MRQKAVRTESSTTVRDLYTDSPVVDQGSVKRAAQHIRDLFAAEWVAIRLEAVSGYEHELNMILPEPDPGSANRVRAFLEGVTAEGVRSTNGSGNSFIHTRQWEGQRLLFAELHLGDNSRGWLVIAFPVHVKRSLSSARARLADLTRFVEQSLELGIALMKDKQKQERMKLTYQVSRDVAALRPLDQLIPQIVATIRDTFHYDAVSLMLPSPTSDLLLTKQVAVGTRVQEFLGVAIPITDRLEGGIVGYVAHTGQSLLVPDVTQEPRYLKFLDETRAELAVPLKIGERIIGVLDVESNLVGSLDESDQSTLEAIADQVAIAIENARLYSELSDARDQVESKTRQLHQLLSRTISIQEEERKRISAELHDGVTQLLVSALYEVQAGSALMPKNSISADTKLAAGQALINESLAEMHRVIHDLRPLMHGDIGMAYALRKLTTTFMAAAGIEGAFEISGEAYKLSQDQEIAAYRVTQEALQNIVRHSGASSVRVSLAFARECVTLVIADNGRGFDQSRSQRITESGNLGLVNMQERAMTIGAALAIHSKVGAGTVIELSIPRGA